MNFALKHHGKSRSQLTRSLSNSGVAVVMFATTMEQGTPRHDGGRLRLTQLYHERREEGFELAVTSPTKQHTITPCCTSCCTTRYNSRSFCKPARF